MQMFEDGSASRRQFLGLSGAALATVGLSALAGCGGAGPSRSAGTISTLPSSGAAKGDLKMVWSYSDPQAGIKKLFSSFQQATPGVKLDVLYNADADKLLAGGTMLDLIHTSDARQDSLALGADLSSVDSSRYYPYTIDPLKIDGKLRALPMFVQVSLLYYNKDLFDAAGLSYPSESWTYAELLSAAKALTKFDSSGKPLQWGLEVEQGWWGSWLIAVRQAGGDAMDASGLVTLNTPEAIRGLGWFNSLMQSGVNKVTPKPTENNLGGFKGGKTAMSFGSHTGNWGVFRSTVPHFDVQVLPTGLTQRKGAELAMDAEAVNQSSPNLAAAGALLEYMTSQSSGSHYWSQLYGPSPRKDVASTLIAVPRSQRPAPQNIEAVYTTIDKGYAVTDPRNKNFVDVALKYLQPKIDLMIEGKLTPAMAAAQATSEANSYLKSVK